MSEPKWTYIDVMFPDENGNPIDLKWPEWDVIYLQAQYGKFPFWRNEVFVSRNQGESWIRCGKLESWRFIFGQYFSSLKHFLRRKSSAVP